MRKVRKELKKLRIDHDYTQEKMAVRLGYNRELYAAVENGKREPSLRFINALMTAFGLTYEQAQAVLKKDASQEALANDAGQ